MNRPFIFSTHLHNQTGLFGKLEVHTGNFQHRFQAQRMGNRLMQRSGNTNDKARNWSQRTIFQDEDIRDDEHVAAVAAAAFSILSLEEAELLNLQKMRERPKFSRNQTMRRKEDNISRRPSYGETLVKKRSSGQDPRTSSEGVFPVRRSSGIPSPRPISPAAGHQKHKVISIQHKNDIARAEAWEKAKIEKIQKRYEKIKFNILSWESERKIQAKLQMERKKSQLEHRREIEIQHYKNKIARIDMIAQGARAQLEGKRRKEVSEAREKANKIRKTGTLPVKCFCFNC